MFDFLNITDLLIINNWDRVTEKHLPLSKIAFHDCATLYHFGLFGSPAVIVVYELKNCKQNNHKKQSGKSHIRKKFTNL